MKKLSSLIPFHRFHSRYYTYGELYYSLFLGSLFILLIIYLRFLRPRTPRTVSLLLAEHYELVCLLFGLFTLIFFYTLWRACGSPLPERKDASMTPRQEKILAWLEPFRPWFQRWEEWRSLTLHAPQVVYEVWRQYFVPGFHGLLVKNLRPWLERSWLWWQGTYVFCHIFILQLLPLILAWEVLGPGEIRLFYHSLWLMIIPLGFRLWHYFQVHLYQCGLVQLRLTGGITLVDGLLVFAKGTPPSLESYLRLHQYMTFYEKAEERFTSFQCWIDKSKDLWALPRYGLYMLVWGYLVFLGL